jgi:hypothetical protein
VLFHRPLPLLGSSRKRPSGVNQNSPDPEGAPEAPEFQQLATTYASSCDVALPARERYDRNGAVCRPVGSGEVGG